MCVLVRACCGADKRVDSANEFKGFYVRKKGKLIGTTKMTILFAGITNVYVNVRGGCYVVFS